MPELDEDVDLDTACALLGVSVDDVIAEFQRRHALKVAKMNQEMVLAQRAGGVRRIVRDSQHGDAHVGHMVHPVSYHYWGQRLGYECWDDPQFVREYLRDNPAARVKTTTDRTSILIDGKRDAAPAAAPVILDAAGRPAA